jgi:FtsP/CotA-like multicopper oxidase with cupredoxin domain
VTHHALTAMAGLVLGITVSDDRAFGADLPPDRQLRLIAKEQTVEGSEAVIRGFLVEEGPEPSSTRLTVPGPPLVLTRGRTTSITVVNRTSEPTTVHWHGMEVESVYDGVAGWSRTGSRVAPLVAPGDSFVVQMAPPRSGTFIYHTHMDETDQLRGGMYGPLLVLEPGEVFDQEVDRVFALGGAVRDGDYQGLTINGQLEPAPQTLRVGTEYRLRFINITPEATVQLVLARDGTPLHWRPLAKDGADLPPVLRRERAAELRFSAGETYDFSWTPTSPGEVVLLVHWRFPTEPGDLVLRQVLRVR